MANKYTGIIKNYKTGELYTRSELKKVIKSSFGLTTEKAYKAYRQKYQNKIRNYKTLTGQNSPVTLDELLYFKAKGYQKQITGEIEKISSASTSAYEKTVQTARETEAQTKKRPQSELRYVESLLKRWRGVVALGDGAPVAGYFRSYYNFEIDITALTWLLDQYGKSLNTRRGIAPTNAGGAKYAISYE